MVQTMTIEELKDRKRSSGYTNREIADKTGIPFGTVQKIFSGGTRSPRRSTLVKLEQFFSEVDAGSYFDKNTEKNYSGIVKHSFQRDISFWINLASEFFK